MKKILFFAIALVALVACGEDKPGTTGGAAKSITLNKTKITLSEIGSERLVATVDPAGSTITWESSNPKVAIVSNGLVTATGGEDGELGTTTITAKSGNVSATCEVEVVSYLDPKVVEVNSFHTMEVTKSEDPNDTIIAKDGSVLFFTDYTILLMTNGMMYDRDAQEFVGPDRCPAFYCIGFGYADNQYIYILGDWSFQNEIVRGREDMNKFYAGVIENDSLSGSFLTECVMEADGYKFGNIYGAIDEGSTLALDQNNSVPRHTLNVTLMSGKASYVKTGKASYDEDSQVSVVDIKGKQYLRIPMKMAEEQIKVSKSLGNLNTSLVRK